MNSSRERWKKAALFGLVPTLGVFAIYFLGIQPLTMKEEGLRKESFQLNQEIESFDKTKRLLSSEIQRIQRYHQQLAKIEEQMPNDTADTWTLNKVYQLLQRHGVKPEATYVIPAPELSEIFQPGGSYEIYYCFCHLKTDLPSLGKFLRDLENSLPIVEVDELTILAGAGGAPDLHEVRVKMAFLKKKS